MTNYYDIHTHITKINCEDIISVYNIRAGITKDDTCTSYFSYGIHPYDVLTAKADFDSVLKKDNFRLVGEIGLDFRFQETVKKQIEIFEYQLDIAIKLNKPVILHVVKSLPQTLSILKKKKFDLPFIVHGFRGNLKQADTIIQNGGIISVSPKLPGDIREILKVHRNSILMETDEVPISIKDHYTKTASLCNIQLDEFKNIIRENIRNLDYELE